MVVEVLLKYFLADLPLIATVVLCMYLVFKTYFPEVKGGRVFLFLVLVEVFENFLLPLIFLALFLRFDSVWAAVWMHVILLLYMVGVGFFLLKARSRMAWFKVFALTAFLYFFLFPYPHVVIQLQRWYGLNGLFILVSTVVVFALFRWLGWKKQKSLLKQIRGVVS